MANSDGTDFLEYLQLQGGRPDLVTKSELLASVRESGFSLSDRQLTFYASEGLVPRSVRVGTRAGAYPASVVWLVKWILAARDAGASIDAIKELLPVWKHLIRAQTDKVLDIAELEYVARQHVTSTEASMGVPRLVSWVMMQCCSSCRAAIELVYKDGTRKPVTAVESTIGFAIARTPPDETSGSVGSPQWYATSRLSLAYTLNHSTDPTTVILGVAPNGVLPPDPVDEPHEHDDSRGIREATAAD